MNIGFITGEFPPMPGGVGDFTRILAERMGDHGHEVHILSRQGSASDSLDVSTVSGWGLGSMASIRAWVRRRGISLVNLQYQTAAFAMSPFIHFLPAVVGVPLVTTFHDLRVPYLFPKAGPLRNWIVMYLARSSAGVIATNQEDDQRLQILPNRRVIPIGSNILSAPNSSHEPSARRKQTRSEAESFVLGHFGFVKEVKGIEYLINALSTLRVAGHDLRLLFIGGRSNTIDGSKDSTFVRELDSRISRLGLSDAVSWTGYLLDSEVSACLREVDLVVLPFNDGASYRRGSLMAAIHHGCAILTTEPAVEVETFEHGHNLWLVPPHSADAIEQAILHLMRDREQLTRLRTGASQLRGHFDWDAIARDTVAYFDTLV